MTVKRMISMLVFVFMLSGCKAQEASLEPMLALRTQIAKGCHFQAQITADYGDQTYTFAMGCQVDAHGNLSFEVIQPQSIAGIAGGIGAEGGKITYENTVLAFSMLADGQLNPASAPYIICKALRGGYIRACGRDGEYDRVSIHDSLNGEEYTVDIWLDSQGRPVQGEICWKERKILTVALKDFAIS